MKLSQYIKQLQEQQKLHGDIDVYGETEFDSVIPVDDDTEPNVVQVYTLKDGGRYHHAGEMIPVSLDMQLEDLVDRDETRPVFKALVK